MKLAPVKIAAGQVIQAGSVLGVVTATGEFKVSVAAAVDGSQIARAIIMEDLDTTLGVQTFTLAVEGFFNETALVYGTGHNASTVRLSLRDNGIYLAAPRYSFA